PPLIFCKCHGTSRPGVQRRFLIVILLVRSLQRSCTPWLAISSSVSSTYSTHFWLRPLPTCSNFYSRARCFSDTAHFIVTTRTGAVENMIVEFNHFFFYLLPSSQMADEFLIQTRPTKPFEGQKPGTSGLRKPTKTFMLPNYVENFVQASLTVAKKHQKPDTQFRLVLGGDGRYFLKEALLNAIVPLCAANGVEEVMIGENGILSTPAISTIIRRYGTTGGFILTASHNPGGIDGDFGLKYNIDNGGPATETITDEIYQITTKIHEYQTLDRPIPIDLTKIGTTDYNLKGGKIFKVTIVSSTQDYITYMKEIFDFDMIKEFLNGGNGKPPFKVLVDGLSGVTGPYIRALLIDNFGLPESSTLDCTPLPDFGGHHPDPNLTYAAKLVDAVRADKSISLAAAFDGDGDRNMIIGQGGFFVCPCDSLAVIADNAESIKYFEKNGVRGFARSMPTSPAVDRVCKDKKIDVYETPTGWKFFGNLLDADKVSVCGEESFGTGSNHIREKDGIWTFLCWASLLAARQAAGLSPRVSDVMKEHWSKYGRDFFTRWTTPFALLTAKWFDAMCHVIQCTSFIRPSACSFLFQSSCLCFYLRNGVLCLCI
uniref:phosphoglucomutase (alpha-D-glucose-1,6-bisphosphate-dependent) n=1 Tax=Mesocestoides corti TaxID=53468 RepID=A0A5K3EJF0_MESCO